MIWSPKSKVCFEITNCKIKQNNLAGLAWVYYVYIKENKNIPDKLLTIPSSAGNSLTLLHSNNRFWRNLTF